MVRLKAYIKMVALDVLVVVKLWLPVRRSCEAWQITGYFECSHGKTNSRQVLIKFLRRAWLIVAAVLFCWGIYNTVGAQDFHVSGVLEAENVFEKKVIRSFPTTQFDVFVSGCKWLIRIEPGLAGGQVEVGYDGDTSRVVAQGGRLTPSASLRKSEVPLAGADPRTAILWIAFAQSCYLNNSITTGRLIPAFESSFFRKPVPVIVEGLTESKKFPSRIVYFDDGTYRHGNGDSIRRHHPFENGFTNFVYKALSFTNIGSYRIPLEFELTQFQPSVVNPATSNDLSVCFHGLGKISMVREIPSEKSFLPVFPNALTLIVNDMRFFTSENSSLPFRYVTNHWLTESEVRMMPQFAAYLKNEAVAKTQNPIRTIDQTIVYKRTPRFFLLMILVGVVTVPGIIIFLGARKVKK